MAPLLGMITISGAEGSTPFCSSILTPSYCVMSIPCIDLILRMCMYCIVGILYSARYAMAMCPSVAYVCLPVFLTRRQCYAKNGHILPQNKTFWTDNLITLVLHCKHDCEIPTGYTLNGGMSSVELHGWLKEFRLGCAVSRRPTPTVSVAETNWNWRCSRCMNK